MDLVNEKDTVLFQAGEDRRSDLCTSLASVTGVAIISKVFLIIFTVAIDTLVLARSYRWLRTAWPSWRSVMPGAIVGGVLFAALQLIGVAIVGRSIAKASPVYGTFASVIGLLSWLSLHAIIALGGAELNAALVAGGPPHPPDCEHEATSARVGPANLA